ncbi:cupin domain-containing protein [Actinomycetospora sp. TBRC 11914]|uniref:cupin domain-containing protein n=1 Tax=Actinomycetospora sp. TBRC 11914 TaxID=2729387 RepID=UPI00145E11E6|nr:cupin domain-containing protein [Actinomycetospora sp. TBRC 11914]NMO92104.1 cupin domain-containing protein [Actinomycetospora sp. TBRC 11914]
MSTPPGLAAALDLAPHPEGGWYRRVWEAGTTVEPPGYGGTRPTATAIHYVLGPGEESVWHRVRSDELWFWHRGATLSLWLGGDGDAPAEPGTALVLGPGTTADERPALLVPGGHWQRAAPRGGGPDDGAVLVSCVVSPGFDFADFTTAG